MKQFGESKRLVVKVGSALLVDDATGLVHQAWLNSLAEDIATLRAEGKDVLLVSSGSVALGRHALGWTTTQQLKLEEKQAAAACGQSLLVQAWKQALAPHDIKVAQVLLTLDDSEDRRRYLNVRSTLKVLTDYGVVPVINENDTVATAELRVGDNDRLAARVAQMASADMVILLSDVDGFYTANPSYDDSAKLIPEVLEITDEVRAMAGDSASDVGTGGMITKLEAAEIAVAAGCHLVVASGKISHPLTTLHSTKRGTCFVAKSGVHHARKDWIGGALKPLGELVVDAGAARALLKGSSLLAAGVVSVSGSFQRGDAVCVMSADGKQLAKGLSAYSVDDMNSIKGRQSREIEALLGFKGRDAVIERDDLVLIG